MADENQPIGQLSSRDFEKMRQEAISTADTIKDISKIIGDNARAISKATGDSAAKFKDSFSASNALAKELSNISAEDLKIKGKSQQIEKKVQAALKEQVGLRSKQKSLLRQATVATGREKELLEGIAELYAEAADNIDAQVENTKKLYGELKRIDKSVQFFDNMDDLVQDVPVLRKFFGEFRKASEAAREAGGGKKGAFAGARELAKAGGKAAAIFAGGTVVKGLVLMNEQTTELSRGLNISRDAAEDLRNSLNTTGRFSIAQMIEGITAVNDELGTSGTITAETAEKMALMTQRLGLSGQQAAKLFTASAGTGKSLEDLTNTIAGTVLLQNDLNKSSVDYKQVLKDVSDAGAAVQLTTEKFPGGIAKAAFNARKFGLSLSQLENSAQGLLNFEESIGAELEAELFTGKELNLERARMAALTGDQATLAAELAKNFGTAKEFQSQNVLAQEAQAKAMGMTRDELAQALMRQEAMANLDKTLTDSRFNGLSAAQQVAYLESQGLSRAEALSKLGKEELDIQKENMSNSEAMAMAATKMQEAVGEIGDPLDRIATAMKGVADFAKLALGSLVAISVLRFGRIGKLGSLFGKGGLKTAAKGGVKGGGDIVKDARLPSGFRNTTTGRAVSKTAGEAAMKTGGKNVAKIAGKTATKSIGKSIVKKIPIIGALAGLGFAISRAASGDYVGAAGELASGIASTIPGLGTAASVAIDAGLAARDISKATSRSNPGGNESMDVNDFTIRSNPKDTLVMAGGTRFGEETNTLLKELISAVKEGGDVFIDGNKAGMALNLGAYRSSTS